MNRQRAALAATVALLTAALAACGPQHREPRPAPATGTVPSAVTLAPSGTGTGEPDRSAPPAPAPSSASAPARSPVDPENPIDPLHRATATATAPPGGERITPLQ
ncbi:hypothetical protein [Kitasatospora sp. LaBMicrA B282]|uniref:hypothetical protein n=1 Tax=Kitasatospora sp. LaBMicrA B282 TaxID=3420949 RepID=UPI003D099007